MDSGDFPIVINQKDSSDFRIATIESQHRLRESEQNEIMHILQQAFVIRQSTEKIQSLQ